MSETQTQDSTEYVDINNARLATDSLVIFPEEDVSEYDDGWYIAFTDSLAQKVDTLRTDKHHAIQASKRERLPTQYKFFQSKDDVNFDVEKYLTTWDEYVSDDEGDESLTVDEVAENIDVDVQAIINELEPSNGEQAVVDVLADVGDIISERDGSGDPHVIHEHIADMWSAYLQIDVDGTDVAYMMGQLKQVRQQHGDEDRDDGLDAVGYAAIAASMGDDT